MRIGAPNKTRQASAGVPTWHAKVRAPRRSFETLKLKLAPMGSARQFLENSQLFWALRFRARSRFKIGQQDAIPPHKGNRFTRQELFLLHHRGHPSDGNGGPDIYKSAGYGRCPGSAELS